MTEQTEIEMRDTTVPTFDTADDLIAYIRDLESRKHDYGTCVYAMSMSAVAAYNYIARKLGVTGFQASCADMDILARTRGLKRGRILDYQKLLYPQYCDAEHYPDVRTLFITEAEWLRTEAAELYRTNTYAVPAVREHWAMLASLPVAPK